MISSNALFHLPALQVSQILTDAPQGWDQHYWFKMLLRDIIDKTNFKISSENNCYVSPSVLINVDHTMKFMMDETFGPSVGIMKVANENEAAKLMNDSPYGLTASIWTADKDFALSFGQKINTGTFFMNRCDYLDPGLAWTGVKDTGTGITLSVLGFDHLTRAKSYHLRTI